MSRWPEPGSKSPGYRYLILYRSRDIPLPEPPACCLHASMEICCDSGDFRKCRCAHLWVAQILRGVSGLQEEVQLMRVREWWTVTSAGGDPPLQMQRAACCAVLC